ncbi:MAG TPA: hypothetical protein VLX91_13805 [Candidatus Acidoferrales bacterium]|nr:hypothetical protein [Candidatus Acidoferrales bacterium]
MDMSLSFPVAILISIVAMAVTIIVSAGLILRIHPLPYLQALEIAAFAYLLGKLFISVFHWSDMISYSLLPIVQILLSYLFFNPTVPKLLLYWILAVALYLAIHLLLTSYFGWTFMFPIWAPRLFE